MKTIDRYLAFEFLLYFFAGILIFLIFIMGNTVLFQMLEFVIRQKVPFPVFMKILLFMLPSFLVLAMPMAALFATMLSVGRLSRDAELDVMRTSGISLPRILAPYLFLGLVFAFSGFYLLQEIVPESNHKSQRIWRQFLLSDVTGKPMSDVFFKGKSGTHFYIRQLIPKLKAVENVVIYDTRAGGAYPRIITAPKGTWTKSHLDLRDGMLIQFNDKGGLNYEAVFSHLKVDIERQMDELLGDQRTAQEMKLQELRQQITLFKKSGIDTSQLETDYHFKMSVPAASLVCILLAMPLSVRTGRSGMMVGIGIAIALIAAYWVLMILDTYLGKLGVLPPVLAAWLQNIVFLIVGLVLVWRTSK